MKLLKILLTSLGFIGLTIVILGLTLVAISGTMIKVFSFMGLILGVVMIIASVYGLASIADDSSKTDI